MSSVIPENYWKVITPLIETAKGFLEKGESLAPIAFVGSFTPEMCIPVVMQAHSNESKDQSAIAIKKVADGINADFIFTVMEAWSLRQDKVREMDAIMDKYGSIGASPYAVDIVSMALETRHGVWMAEVPIKAKGISKKKRTIGTPEFRHFAEYSGRFVNLLPIKVDATTLH
jgi:hypothetical protein